VLKFGRETVFFDLLDKQAQVAEQAATAFLAMVRDIENHTKHAKAIEEIEHRGDELTHQLQNKIVATFITPLDQEDLSEMSHVLDDITDYIEAVAARIELYRLTSSRPDLEPLAVQLVQITRLVVSAISELRNGFQKSQTLKETLKEIHTVENESDKLFRTALAGLFDEPGIDPLTVMKWKEVYDRVETSVDRCEDVAKILDNVIVKYA
jgi:predicted phosphate transport protein (TIGR00153 family)